MKTELTTNNTAQMKMIFRVKAWQCINMNNNEYKGREMNNPGEY